MNSRILPELSAHMRPITRYILQLFRSFIRFLLLSNIKKKMRFSLPLLSIFAVALAAPQAKPACSPQINQLATGIQKNIDAQRGERASIDSIGQMLAASPTDIPPAQFMPAKIKLLNFVNNGIAIRQSNQQLARGNRAEAGLAKVEQAQRTELQLSNGLSGSKARDLTVVTMLQAMFDGGTKQNMMNLADVSIFLVYEVAFEDATMCYSIYTLIQ
jgi:hypothetical protein